MAIESYNVDIDFDEDVYLPAYRPIVGSDADFLALWGGRDSGKTHHIAQELIIKCLEADYFRCILVKKTYESIKDAQWQTIKDIVEEWGLDELFVFLKNPLEIHCVNGNKFIARGCDKPEKVKSVRNPSDAWYEEMDQLTEDDHIIIQTTLRAGDGIKVKEWASFNPECKELDFRENWLFKYVGERYEHFVDEKIVEIRNPDTGETQKVPLKVEAVHTTIHDNPFANAQRRARMADLASRSTYYESVYYLGRWGKKEVQSPFASAFSQDKHVSIKAVRQENRQIYITLDFNLEPFGFILENKWRDGEGFHCYQFDEAKIEKGSLDSGIDWIRDKYGHLSHLFVISGDAMGKRRDFGQRDLRNYYERIRNGLRIRPNQIQTKANPTHKKSRDDMNYILDHFDEYLIHPNCRETIHDLERVEVDAFGSIMKTDRKNVAQRADFLDCKRYSINDKFFQTWIKWDQRRTKKNP